MDIYTAIGLGVFVLIAVVLGWLFRLLQRAVTGRVGPAFQAFQAEANRIAAARASALSAQRAANAVPGRPAAPQPRPRRPAPPQTDAAVAAAAARTPRHHRKDEFLGPFHRRNLLGSIIVAEALAQPLALRPPERR